MGDQLDDLLVPGTVDVFGVGAMSAMMSYAANVTATFCGT